MSPVSRSSGRFGSRLNLRLLRVCAVLLPLVALLASGIASWNSVEGAARGRVERAADMLREHAMRAFEAQGLALAAIELRLRGLRWQDIPQDRALYDFLLGVDTANIDAADLALIDPGSRLVMASGRPFGAPPLDVAGRDYAAAHAPGSEGDGSAFIGQVVRAKSIGRMMIPIVLPRRVVGADGIGAGDGGAVLAVLAPERFEEFYRSILETPGDSISLFRLDGAVLAAVPVPVEAEGAALPRSAGQVLSALRQGPVATLVGASPIDLVPRITAFRRLDRHPVGIAYGIPLATLHADWRRRMLGPLAGAMLAMLLLLAATVQAERAARARASAAARARASERQATLGLLAGGLAHDFGNITQSVVAAAQLLQRHAEDAPRVRRIAEHLHRHAARSAALTRRLLKTTRRIGPEERAPGPVEISTALREVCEVLDLTLRGGIRVRCEAPPGLLAAPGIDQAELETAMINLAANARDAMPEGGEVVVSAGRVAVPPGLPDAPEMPPGPYLRISVRDSGEGMPAEALARLAEPFFTTKAEGRGTGLGLAMVAAFLRGSGGALTAESAPGRGTTIHMILPAI